MSSPAIDSTVPESLQVEFDRLRQLNTLDIQSRWRWHTSDLPITEISKAQQVSEAQHHWPIAPLNERQHIAWEKGRQVRWLYQFIRVPTHFHGYPLTGLTLHLALTWWADDAQIYVNGQVAQSGDLFECFTRLCLKLAVTPGDTFEIAIRLVSPGHDEGALVRSQLIYELPDAQPTPEPSFIADELTVLATLETSSQSAIKTALTQLNWDSLTETNTSGIDDAALGIWNALSTQPLPAAIHPFHQSLSHLRRTLIPWCDPLQQRTIQCVGHAHLDMAWLWPVADTWNAAERTFRSVLDLQKDFPELTYTHSSPALFEWLEHNRPELFQQIQQKVKEGSWSIDAGLWIEPEFNVISGEAIARHILYGQRYCQEKFGSLSKIAWLPDSFGFCWQLPQLLSQGGIGTFATLKLSWNDTTQFPHQLFWWQSPDGSRILSLMLPPIGSDIDPIKMADHASSWQKSTGIADSFWLPGLGDHGGGPTRDMLEKAQRWEKSPFFPNLTFTTPNRYIDALPKPKEDLPVWKDELYLELHRGCYTTHAEQKQQNRRCEDLLYQAEVFATIAQIIADQAYPRAQLDIAWKKLLFNQFHDILPGTSIPEVFSEANRDWANVKDIGNQVLNESLGAIASTILLPTPPHPQAKPILVFNSLNWERSSVIAVPLPPETGAQNWTVYGPAQQIIPHQITSTKTGNITQHQVLFSVQNLPAVGYQCFWICPAPEATPEQSSADYTLEANYTLENEFLRACIDPTTGQITSLIEKSTQTEAFSSPGNQLQAFRDQGQYWDAWNIAPDYEKHPLPQPILKSIEWIETGSIRQRLRIHYQLNASTISQDYILDADTPFLKVENTIHWQENQVLLKVNFPLSVSSDIATYEIPFGAIARSTNPQTEADKAKWEVPALRWADLSNPQGNPPFGISLLTDSKHGFDASQNHLRLTLLKSPLWPDPQADRGWHHFTYAIYPHPGSWQTAHTVRHARALNIASTLYPIETASIPQPSKTLIPTSTSRSFLTIHNPNLILSALKPTEDNPQEFILRCYEAHGEATNLNSENSLNLTGLNKQTQQVSLLETPTSQINRQSGSLVEPTHVSPWQISTYRLNLKGLS
jgi:alpha-mannosidase